MMRIVVTLMLQSSETTCAPHARSIPVLPPRCSHTSVPIVAAASQSGRQALRRVELARWVGGARRPRRPVPHQPRRVRESGKTWRCGGVEGGAYSGYAATPVEVVAPGARGVAVPPRPADLLYID